MPSATGRSITGLLGVSAVVAMGLLVSPSATIATAASLATDPLLFGLVVAALYLGRPLFAWPTTALAVVVGYGYGVILGVPIALLGVAVTVSPVFCVVRWVSGPDESADRESVAQSWIGGPVGGLLNRTSSAIDRYYGTAGPLRGVIASRLAPIPSDIATAAAAGSTVRFRTFLVGSVIGELPWTIAAVVVGASATTVTTDGLGEVGLSLTVACLLAAGLLLAGPAYRVARDRHGSADSGTPIDG